MVRPVCQVCCLHCGEEQAKRLKLLVVCTERGVPLYVHEPWMGCSMYAAKKTLIQSLTASDFSTYRHLTVGKSQVLLLAGLGVWRPGFPSLALL